MSNKKVEYDDIGLVCRCGQEIKGTIIRDKEFSFTCINCQSIWTGRVTSKPPFDRVKYQREYMRE